MADVTLRHIQNALEARDPRVVSLIVELAHQPIPYLDSEGKPYREGAATFIEFLNETRSNTFRKKPKEDQEQYRVQQLALLEKDDAEIPFPDRLRVHEVIETLWRGEDVFSRSTLITLLRVVPLTYGSWRALKLIFKEAEAANDTEVYGILAARVDLAIANGSWARHGSQDGPTIGTLQYMRRRAWQYLRRVGETLPAIYPDVASDFLAAYSSDLQKWDLQRTWVAAHILFHENGNYTRNRFKKVPTSLTKHRAFSEAWLRSPRPLFSLLERAKSDVILRFTTDALKTDFRTSLREVEPEWVIRLLAVRSSPVDDFAVWILENVPKFEQTAFRDLELHESVLQLLNSDSNTALKYAVGYAKTHARDLDLPTLVKYSASPKKLVSTLAHDLILERDPRKEVGLEGWGQLLNATRAAKWVQDAIRKHFGISELTPEWFGDKILNAHSYQSCEFFQETLLKLHPAKKLGHGYFIELLEYKSGTEQSHDHLPIHSFCAHNLFELGPKGLGEDALKRLLANPKTTQVTQDWVHQGLIEPKIFTPEFLKMMAFHPERENSEWVKDFKQSIQSKEEFTFSEDLSEVILSWLRDIRKFTPDQLGFEWLMKLVQRSEKRYHDFAVDTMVRAFLPADFAPQEEEAPQAAASSDVEIKVDLEGQKFLFTGKLATMTRGEAKKKVTAAGGANAAGVAKTLDFLVIGDEGSPLYDQGRKGSKQLKAEALREEGADLKVISETAFLQMLSGEVREFSDDALADGCKQLWSMMVDAKREDDPLAAFALQYFRGHHPEICLLETDRPVDPGAEIPDSFLTFDQLKPLFSSPRKTLRDFALEMASWEFARWAPPISGIIDLCEVPYEEVQAFVAKALTANDDPEHKRYRINHDVLTPEAVYSFCESNDGGTRDLGMLLIERNPRLRLPEELFRLTESPDRQVRAFVLRAFWSLYRERDSTKDWKPTLPPQVTTGKKAKKNAVDALETLGEGAPARPENLPAKQQELESLLRRILYELPPGPPEKSSGTRIKDTLKPLPNRKAKLYLIETMRDLSMEEEGFAQAVFPLLNEFMKSRGQSEFEACLVAVTRLKNKWNLEEVAA